MLPVFKPEITGDFAIMFIGLAVPLLPVAIFAG
jgi:hypothetical protein